MSKPAKTKRVRVTVELSSSFVGLLAANCNLTKAIRNAQALDNTAQLTPTQVLAMLVLAEARGAKEDQIAAMTPCEWRPDIDLVHDERRVYEGGAQIAGPTMAFVKLGEARS